MTFNKLKTFAFGLSLLASSHLFAQDKPSVNVLTWFGYLKAPEIASLVEQECGVTLSYDEYYSNEEFLRRWKSNKDNYDIIIFANLLYEGIKDQIAVSNSNLAEVSKNYHPVIKEHYDSGNYPPNTVFFSHSLMGFLWNPERIHLSEKDDMFTVFKKAEKNRVILIDDPVEVRNMIHLALNNQTDTVLNLNNMQKLVQSSQVTLSNDYNKIYENTEFAFSYLWSGEAVIDTKKSGKPYQFLMHPKTSFICTDLLAVINKKTSSNCVAKVLTSKQAMTILQNDSYYFSPYGDFTNVTDEAFRVIYQKTFEQIAHFSWIKPVTLAEFNQLTQTWKTLKLEVSKHKEV